MLSAGYVCLLIIEKSTFFSCSGAMVLTMEKFKSTKRSLWQLLFFSRLCSYFSGLFLSFFCNLFFFDFHHLIEYIRQLINLYNKIETTNLLGFVFFHTLNYTLNRYEYASLISLFISFL